MPRSGRRCRTSHGAEGYAENVRSSPEPWVILPDGGGLAQMLAVAGGALKRRAGLPWPYAGSTFASDGEHVGCFRTERLGNIEGLCITSRATWLFGPGLKSGVFTVYDGRVYGVDDYGVLHVALADLAEWPRHERNLVHTRFMPTLFVPDGDRMLILCCGDGGGTEHNLLAMDPRAPDREALCKSKITKAVPYEDVRHAYVADGELVVASYSDVADAISFYERETFGCTLRIVRDAVIPRWLSSAVIDDTLVVADDRPGMMSVPLESLRRVYRDGGPDAGARAAAAALRSTWRESQIGAVQKLEAIPGTRTAVAVVEKNGAIGATLWSL